MRTDNGLTRRRFLAGLGGTAAAAAIAPSILAAEPRAQRTNVLLITADDMNWDSLGVTGSKTPDVSPNIDALASQGVRFEMAHVNSAICQPSRSVIMTGRYPHRNGAMGFDPINADCPDLVESLKAAGYLNAIFAKKEHLKPDSKFPWDVAVTGRELGRGRNPAAYYERCKAFFDQAKSAGKPFFAMANSQDPHRPFPGAEGEPGSVSRTFKPEEVEAPGFLPQDVPDIRKEMAQYYTAVHRCDETVGQILRALKESGQEDNTLVIFLSDNGISVPFAKTNCYQNSTLTPLILRWPGKIEADTVNSTDMVSGVDLMPTILEAAGAAQAPGMDGRSVLPLLRGEKQDERDRVFTFITKTVSNLQVPMRSVRTPRFSYIFNAWSDGKTRFQNEAMGGLTFNAMRTAGENDKTIADRVNFYLHRTREEFYDLQADPNEMKNLFGSAKHKAEIEKLRGMMMEMMVSTKDPLLDEFRKTTGG